MKDEVQTFMLSLRRWSNQPDDAPAAEMMVGAADLLDELLSKLVSYREHSINKNSMGASCKLCHGAWAFSRGAEMHEDWCPNKEPPK